MSTWSIFADPYHAGQQALIKGDVKKLSHKVLHSQSKKTGLSLFHYFIINSKEVPLDYSQTIDIYLQSGVNINLQANEGHGYYSALHFAVEQEDFALAKLLVEKGIDIGLRDKSGNTAFWNACHNYRGKIEQEKIIEYLYDHGASINDTNDSGVSVNDLVFELGDSIDQGLNPKEWDLRKLKLNRS